MKYLVMECGLSYAIVLDEQGHFLKAANLNYQVGQELDQVVLLRPRRKVRSLRRAFSLTAVAACICLLSMLVFQYVIFPVGTVRMTINPDVAMKVNRLHYVVGLEGLNQDGEELIQGVSYSWKRVEEVSDVLADRAVDMGYLSQGDEIRLSVESGDTGWKTTAEEMVLAELEIHFENEITIVLWDEDEDSEDDEDHDDDEDSVMVSQPQEEKPTPAPTPKKEESSGSKAPSSSQNDDDDDDDDRDDDNNNDSDSDDDGDNDHDDNSDDDRDDDDDDDNDDSDDDDDDSDDDDDDDDH